MIDMETVNSIKIIGQLRKKQDYFSKIFDIFSKQSDKIIESLENAIQSKDQISIYRLSHKLKGGAQSIGAVDLGKRCYELEDWSNSEDGTNEFQKANSIFEGIKSSYQKSKDLLKTL